MRPDLLQRSPRLRALVALLALTVAFATGIACGGNPGMVTLGVLLFGGVQLLVLAVWQARISQTESFEQSALRGAAREYERDVQSGIYRLDELRRERATQQWPRPAG
jgi:hypothetical protein